MKSSHMKSSHAYQTTLPSKVRNSPDLYKETDIAHRSIHVESRNRNKLNLFNVKNLNLQNTRAMNYTSQGLRETDNDNHLSK